MIKGQVWLLVFILFYFGFYCIKFRDNIRLKPLVDIKTEFQSDIDLFYEHISFKNWKKAIVSILLIIIGIIILVFLSILGLFLLILKISLLFLKKIVIYEADNKFEIFKYVLLPMILAYLFGEYAKTVKISNTSLNIIIIFGDKIIQLFGEYTIISLTLLISATVCYIFKFLVKNDIDFIKELFEYFWNWIKVLIVTLLFILIIGSYLLLLDEVKNSISSKDPYTIIPIFITSCIVFSNIIIKLIAVKSKKLSVKAKRAPYRTRRKYRSRRTS